MKFLVAVLVAYLGWRLWRGPARRRPRPATGGAPPADLGLDRTLAEARALLGVPPGAGAAEIRAAHRRLMADAHPDRGGTTERARQLNLARDALLGALGA
ncbi:MAG: J domain-containing protein [Sphingomonas sp.]|nr:J domain-containing protein [Sphingomonas sp.]